MKEVSSLVKQISGLCSVWLCWAESQETPKTSGKTHTPTETRNEVNTSVYFSGFQIQFINCTQATSKTTVIQSQWYEPPTACENSGLKVRHKFLLKCIRYLQIQSLLWRHLVLCKLLFESYDCNYELLIPFTFAVYFLLHWWFCISLFEILHTPQGVKLNRIKQCWKSHLCQVGYHHPYVRLDIIINVTQKHAKFGVTQS